MAKNHQLATIAPAGELAALDYAILSVEPADIVEMLAENTGEANISEFDLDRVKVPAGGSTTWSVPSLEGEEEVKAITGVIVYQRTVRSFWEKRMEESGGGTPPDCSSQDGIYGVGTPKLGDIEHPGLVSAGVQYNSRGEPGHEAKYECKFCPLAAFGSGSNGRSQACKQSRLIFVLREQSILPLLIAAPPSSLRPMKQYMLRLSGAGVPFYGVVTSFGLHKLPNADNIQYSEIVPSMVQRLSADDTAKMRAVSRALAPVLSAVSAEAEPEPTAPDETQAFLEKMRAEA